MATRTKASAAITVSLERDVSDNYRFYQLAASAPSKPTEQQGLTFIANKIAANYPSGWTLTEPQYTSGSTNNLYTCDLTEFTDGGVSWSEVSQSTAYEAAKQAYNKAQDLDDELDMEGVFNRLTNNGDEEGLYIENDHLYINGTMIKANSISATTKTHM